MNMITFDNSLFTGNRNKDPATFRQITIPKDATCYICSGGGSPSEPLVSDCSCTDNVAHIKCIANFAAGGVINSSIKDWLGCKDRWMTCSACTQPHQNELSIALAVRLVDFTKEAYPTDGVIIINARILVLREITDMFMSTSQSCYRNKGIEMANDILRRIGQINISDETIRLKIIFAMASVFNSLGDITLGSGTNNSIQQAVRYYEKCLELCKSIDVEERVVELAENGLAKANHLLNSTAQINDIMRGLEGLLVGDRNGLESDINKNDLDIRNNNKRRKRDAVDISDNTVEASDQEMRDDGLKNQVQIDVKSTENTFEMEMIVSEGDSEPRVTFQKNDPADTSVTSSKDDDAGRIEESGNGLLLDDQDVSLLRQTLTNYSHNTEDDVRGDDSANEDGPGEITANPTTDAQTPQDEVVAMEMDINAPTSNILPPTSEQPSSQPFSDDCEQANEHDIEPFPPLKQTLVEDGPQVRRSGRRQKPMLGNPTMVDNMVDNMDDDISMVESDNYTLLDGQGVSVLQQSLPTYLRNTYAILSNYNTTKTPKNTAITEKSNNMIALFERNIQNSINALGLSTKELESLAILTQLDITNESTSGSRFDAFQTQYGTGDEDRRLILPKLKEEMYNIVKRYGLSPFSDNSKRTEEIHKILVSGIVKGDSASSITKAIRDGNEKHNWAAPKFSSRPILEQQSNENDILAPMVATLARGSRGTDNDLTSQIVKCTTTPYLLVKTGILPSHTELVQQVFAAFNTDRDEVCDAQAVSSFISFLLKIPQEQVVYLSVNEILRIGLPPKDIVTLVLVFIKIHPNIKLISASELCMPFLGVVLRNYEFYDGEKLINQVLGCQKTPGGVRVGYLDSELQYTLDAEITIDNEYQFLTNGSITTITKLASLLLPHWRAIEGRKDTVFQIERGIELGLSHPKAETILSAVLLVVNEVAKHVTDITLTLDQQHDNIDEAMDEKIAAKLHISIGKKKYVIIYLRSTHINQSDSIFELAAEQFTICYAAGVARKLINKDTDLIIIFDNGKSRDGELNPGLARAFAYICDGSVLAFISTTSIRCTSIRVLFKCLQGTCTGSKTQLITAQHSSELAGVIMEYQHGRNVAYKIRSNTFDVTSKTLRGSLGDLALRLNEYIGLCSGWTFRKEMSLFSDQLKHAIKQQRLEKEAKKAAGTGIGKTPDKRATEVVRKETAFLQMIYLQEDHKASSLCRRARAYMKLGNYIEALRDFENAKPGVLPQYQAWIDNEVCM